MTQFYCRKLCVVEFKIVVVHGGGGGGGGGVQWKNLLIKLKLNI